MRKTWPLFLISLSIFFIEICNELTTTGMFMDGLIYDNLAANMSKGIGSFWRPILLPSLGEPFVGHPPLAFGLLALCYKVFGVHIAVAKGFSLFMIFLSGLLLLRLWERVGFSRRMGWLPLILWISVPMVSQYACDNMLEGTMGVFVLAAVLCMLHFPQSPIKRIGWHFLAGVCLYLAFLTKGPTGLYPLCLPLIIWLVDRFLYHENRHYGFFQALACCLIPLIAMLLCGGIVALLQPEALVYFKDYLSEQVMLGTNTVTVQSRWYIVAKFFERTAVSWALVVLILGIMHFRKGKSGQPLVSKTSRHTFWVFILLTLSGVIPMMVSTKQSAFYIYTVFPFFAVAIGALLNDTVERWLSHGEKRFQITVIVLAFVLAIAAVVTNIANCGKPGRDVEKQHDVNLIASQVEKGTIIAMPLYMNEDYSLINYAYRNKQLELIGTDFDNLGTSPNNLWSPLPQYLLTEGNTPVPDSLYHPVDLPTHSLCLFCLNP